MFINSTAELAQKACSTFEENQTLTIYANRSRSTFPVSSTLGSMEQVTLEISKDLRDACLNSVDKKTNEVASHYFLGNDGKTYYIDKDVIDKFTETTKAKYPNLKFIPHVAVVDKETDIELMPNNTAKDYMIPEGISIVFKISSWTAQIMPKKEATAS